MGRSKLSWYCLKLSTVFSTFLICCYTNLGYTHPQTRVPSDSLTLFKERKNRFANALEQQTPQALAKWAYWEVKKGSRSGMAEWY